MRLQCQKWYSGIFCFIRKHKTWAAGAYKNEWNFREHDRRNPSAKRSTKFVHSWVFLRFQIFGSEDLEEGFILIADYSYWHSVSNTEKTPWLQSVRDCAIVKFTINTTRYTWLTTGASKIDIEVWYSIICRKKKTTSAIFLSVASL